MTSRRIRLTVLEIDSGVRSACFESGLWEKINEQRSNLRTQLSQACAENRARTFTWSEILDRSRERGSGSKELAAQRVTLLRHAK